MKWLKITVVAAAIGIVVALTAAEGEAWRRNNRPVLHKTQLADETLFILDLTEQQPPRYTRPPVSWYFDVHGPVPYAWVEVYGHEVGLTTWPGFMVYYTDLGAEVTYPLLVGEQMYRAIMNNRR